LEHSLVDFPVFALGQEQAFLEFSARTRLAHRSR
jgi:hypothetical protein